MQLPIASHKNPNNEYIYWQYYCDIRMHACEPLNLSKQTIWETCVGPSILHIMHCNVHGVIKFIYAVQPQIYATGILA